MQTFSIQRQAASRPQRAPAATPVQELNEFVGGLSGSISARLAAEMAKSIHLPEGQLRKLFETAVPAVLKAEFASSLLARGPTVRATRAKLAHVLSSVELAEAAPARIEAVSPEMEAAVPEDEDSSLTSEQAAQLLHVSRSHVNGLADSGALGKVMKTLGGHRRIPRASVLAYKEQSKRSQAKGLEAMMAATDEAGLYDLELESAPRRKRKSR